MNTTDNNSPQEVSLGLATFGKLIQEINQRLGAGIADEKILDFIFDSLDLMIPYDRMGIGLVDDSGQMTLHWVKSKIVPRHLPPGYSQSIVGTSLETLLATGKARIIDDLVDYFSAHPLSVSTRLIIKDGIRSSLTVPISIRGKPAGAVFFSSSSARTYNQSHVETFSAVANEIASLVEEARLKQVTSTAPGSELPLSRVLHDLKSPLGVIQGFLNVAMNEPWYERLDAEAKEFFYIMIRNSEYMRDLIDELSELSSYRVQIPKAKLAPVDIIEFCTEVAVNARFLTEKKDIRFDNFLDLGDRKIVAIDRRKIWRVLDNLISNAVKYSKRGTSVKLIVTAGSDRLTFDVRDEGLGIPREEFAKLFREYGMTSVRPTEGEGSSGLGLAIVKKIAESHDGGVSVESSVGQGSTFSFWVPLR